MNHTRYRSLVWLSAALLLTAAGVAAAQCPEEPRLDHHNGAGSTACPCFIPNEQAGVVFQIPAAHYPIEILRVGIGWSSLFGGSPQVIEQGIHIYNGGLPNPGLPVHSTLGPQLTDGVINEFNLEPEPGEIIIPAPPTAVTIKFLNSNASDAYAPTVIHDGNGCRPGENLIYANPGGWFDACAVGVSGDWVFHLVYREVNCVSDVPREYTVGSRTGMLHPCYPNPFNPSTTIAYEMSLAGNVRLAVYSPDGRRVAMLADGHVDAGRHEVVWHGRDTQGRLVPSGVYFYRLEGPGFSETKQMVLLK